VMVRDGTRGAVHSGALLCNLWPVAVRVARWAWREMGYTRLSVDLLCCKTQPTSTFYSMSDTNKEGRDDEVSQFDDGRGRSYTLRWRSRLRARRRGRAGEC